MARHLTVNQGILWVRCPPPQPLFRRKEIMNNHFYVYYKSNNIWVYERTCGTEGAAKNRVKELKEVYKKDDAKYLINEVLEGAFY